MQLKSSQLPQSRALVNPHSGCTSISIHAAWRAKDLIRAVLLFLLPLGLALMAPIALHAQAVVSFTGVQSTVGSGLNYPNGVAVDAAGDVFIADTWNNSLVKVPAGCISPACQTTVVSDLNTPQGVAVDRAGNVFIADGGNRRVVKVPAGCSSSCDEFPMLTGSTAYPTGIAVDGAGDLFMAYPAFDQVNEAPNGCASLGCTQPVRGGWNQPQGVAVDTAGDVFIADTWHNQVVKLPAGTTVGSGLFGPTDVATKREWGPIWTVPAEGGPEKPVPELQRYDRIFRSWGLIREGIYFMSREEGPRQTVRFFSFATRKVSSLLGLDKEPIWSYPDVALSSDGRRLLTARLDQEVNDLMLIENFR